MLPKLTKKESPFRKVSPNVIRPRSNSNKPSDNQFPGRRSRQASPFTLASKAKNLQQIFRRVDKDEENYFLQLLQELS